jgi:hypothetical protein
MWFGSYNNDRRLALDPCKVQSARVICTCPSPVWLRAAVLAFGLTPCLFERYHMLLTAQLVRDGDLIRYWRRSSSVMEISCVVGGTGS